jgi:hypothetical protein
MTGQLQALAIGGASDRCHSGEGGAAQKHRTSGNVHGDLMLMGRPPDQSLMQKSAMELVGFVAESCALWSTSATQPRGSLMSNDDVAAYNARLDPQRAAIAYRLRAVIDAQLPQAVGRTWHAIPVWFVGENPVVGYTERKTGVMLMFWNGQHFDEPELEASGSFHMAQIAFEDAAQIDEQKLAGWLAKAASSIWDMVSERNAAVAAQRAERARAKAEATAAPARKPKRKPKAKPKAKVKAKAKSNVRSKANAKRGTRARTRKARSKK